MKKRLTLALLILLAVLPSAEAQVDIPNKPHSVNTIWNGHGSPTSGLGTDGDFYIDTLAYVMYGPKANGAWGSGFSLLVVSSGGGGTGTGPTGPQGPTGPAGPTGPQGPAGSAATIAVGTTTTGAAGSSAAVSNTGSSSAAIFNFTIPQGATGATGPQGPQGPQGPVGPAESTGNANYSDAEVPTGTINGTNVTFTLANAPSPAGSLQLLKNGVMMAAGQDFTLSASTVTFINSVQPQTGDTLQCWYRYAGTGSSYTYADAETPGGSMNGTNATFTLAYTPLGLSLELTRNGLMQRNGVDYTLSGSTLTFLTGSIPVSTDILQAWYRH